MRPRLSSRACRLPSVCVVDELSVDHIGQSAFQAAHGFFVTLPGGAFTLVIGVAVALGKDRADMPG